MAGKQDLLTELLTPVVESLDCQLWGVEYRAQGKHSMLRVYIDKESGVQMEDCERVSRQASSVLDVEDPISGEYTLEVSSPGMERSFYRLNQYQAYIGSTISVRLRAAFDGRKNFTGPLKGIENDEIVLEVDGEEYLLPYELIDKANLVPTY